jgi:hypothetical protein
MIRDPMIEAFEASLRDSPDDLGQRNPRDATALPGGCTENGNME